jgi:hypothetical protein
VGVSGGVEIVTPCADLIEQLDDSLDVDPVCVHVVSIDDECPICDIDIDDEE